MRRPILIACLLLTTPAWAQTMLQTGAGTATSVAGSSYTGPGDIVSGAKAWFGLRAYSGAYASSLGLAANLRRASDSVACDFDVTNSGAFGLTTATCNSSTQGGVTYGTFVGTDATASCTVSGTSAVCTGASGTIHGSDPVTGTGLSQPCIVTVTNGSTTATMELAGTTTACGSVGVAETFTFQVAGFIHTLYDQSGGSNCSGPCTATQTTNASQDQFLPNCGNSLPCIYGNGTYTGTAAGSFTTVAQPDTAVAVYERFTTAGNQGVISAASNNQAILGPSGVANKTNLIASGGGANSFTATAADGALHSVQGIFNATTSAAIVDGVSTSGSVVVSTGWTSTFYVGSINGAAGFAGYLDEGGIWSGSFNSTQYGSMCHNQYIYYGSVFTSSC